jgi:hypothetical protein
MSNTELEAFLSDMGESIGLAKATEKQREIGKAWLRHAIAHARSKAHERDHSRADSKGAM